MLCYDHGKTGSIEFHKANKFVPKLELGDVKTDWKKLKAEIREEHLLEISDIARDTFEWT